MTMEITIPHNFTPRKYQIEAYNSLAKGYKRGFLVFHRRAGKDKLCFNLLAKEAFRVVGTYAYFLPTYNQGRKVIWDGIDNDGFRFIDHLPEVVRNSTNGQEMKIELKNGSIIQVIGTDNYDNVRGMNLRGAIFSEYAFQNPMAWEVVRPILAANDGWAIFNTTPNGKNHAYKLFLESKENERWFSQVLTVEDTGVVPDDVLEDEKRSMSREMFLQEYYCFPKGTDIFCQNEVKDISNIKIGDIVLTHSGRFREVKKLYKREYFGELVKIKSYGINKDLILTPNHPVRIVKDGSEYEWKAAGEIVIGDRVCFPKTIMGKMKYISEDMARLIAWYIAEGSVNKQSVIFTLNANEKEYIKEIMDIVGGAIIDNGSAIQIQVNNAELKDFLVEQCGKGASNKRIPFSLISGWEDVVYETLVKGDGHTFKEGKNFKTRYTTISKTLAYQVMFLANTIGKATSIKEDLCEGESVIMGRKVHVNNRYSVNVRELRGRNNGTIRSHKYSVSGYVCDVSREKYSGDVYNFHTQYDESYVANGRVVHNCSFDVGMIGSVYGEQLESVPTEPLPIYPERGLFVVADIGISDSTALWFFQKDGNFLNAIHYYENRGKQAHHYFQYIQDFADRKSVMVEKLVLPHDSKKRSLVSSDTVLSQAQDFFGGHKVHYQPIGSIQGRIQTARTMMPRMRIDGVTCSLGLDALQNYKFHYDEKKKSYSKDPEHNWASHGSDAFGYSAEYFSANNPIEKKHVKVYRQNSDRLMFSGY